MHKFLGTEVILDALLKGCQSPTESRSYAERYNKIMEALYGKGAKSHYIEKHPNQQKGRLTSSIFYDLVLVKMYEYDPEGKMDSKALAKAYVSEIEHTGTEENAVVRLASQFRSKRDLLKNKETRDMIREIARIQLEDWGYSGIHHDGIESIRTELKHWDWDI